MKFRNKEIKYEAISPDLWIGIVSDEEGNIFDAQIDEVEMPVNIDLAKLVYDKMQYAVASVPFSDFLNNLCAQTEKELTETEELVVTTTAWNLGHEVR